MSPQSFTTPTFTRIFVIGTCLICKTQSDGSCWPAWCNRRGEQGNWCLHQWNLSVLGQNKKPLKLKSWINGFDSCSITGRGSVSTRVIASLLFSFEWFSILTSFPINVRNNCRTIMVIPCHIHVMQTWIFFKWRSSQEIIPQSVSYYIPFSLLLYVGHWFHISSESCGEKIVSSKA